MLIADLVPLSLMAVVKMPLPQWEQTEATGRAVAVLPFVFVKCQLNLAFPILQHLFLTNFSWDLVLCHTPVRGDRAVFLG